MAKLHILFLPFIAHGHMIPILDMAKLFASRDIKTTIISTAAFAEPIKQARDSGIDIGLILIKFPPEESGLPSHVQSINQLTSPELTPKFYKALFLLQEPVEEVIQELVPTCLVSDFLFPWTADSAMKFGIPRLVFHGSGFFSSCATEEMKMQKHLISNLSSDSEALVLPNLPHRITLLKSQISSEFVESNDFAKYIDQARDAIPRSYGMVINSFYELEPDYADHYKKGLGRKAWHIGPLFKNGAQQESRDNAQECLSWLDTKKANSVIYVCFGSLARFTPVQMHETAIGLESSGQDFIWVVREEDEVESQNWLPEGFEEKLIGKSLIIRGWAPQRLILDHPAVNAFLTHCGWNSILEGVCAGLPMVTWPLCAEQFFNEKLVTEVLKMGISVGNKKWRLGPCEGVTRAAVSVAVRQVMVGEAASELRSRAKYYKDMSRIAVEEGGSSCNDLCDLLEELRAYSPPTIRGDIGS